MNVSLLRDLIDQGKLIRVSEEEYRNEVRGLLQQLAGTFIEEHQDIKAQLALMEVQRLDLIHGGGL